MRRIIAGLIVFAGVAFAQSSRFEVASIKTSSPDAPGSSILTDKVGGLNAENMPLRALITMAYGIRDFQLSGGPGWVGTDRYDVMAKPGQTEGAPGIVGSGSITD